MTVAEIIALAQQQAEEVYDDPTWISYINACLDDLTPVAKVLKSRDGLTVNLTNGSGVIDILADTELKKAHEILYVYAGGNMLRRLPVTDNVSQGYKVYADKIILQGLNGTSTTCRIDYYQKLQHVSSLADDLETVSGLPSQYHNLIVLYCCAKSQQKEEELNDKVDFYNEYMLGKQQMAIERMWQMEPQNRKFIRRARIAALLGAKPES